MYLSEVREEGRARVEEIANKLGVPRNYLSKILHVLAREGILESTRGPHGGFRLTRPGTEVSLASVVGHFDDLAAGGGCLLGRETCSEADPCAAHARWKSIAESVSCFFQETSVAELSGGGPGGFLVPLDPPSDRA